MTHAPIDYPQVPPAPPRRRPLGLLDVLFSSLTAVALVFVTGALVLFTVVDLETFALTGGFSAADFGWLAAAQGVALLGGAAVVLLPAGRNLGTLGLKATTLRWLLIAVAAGVALRAVSVGALLLLEGSGVTFDNPQEDVFAPAIDAGASGLLAFGAAAVVIAPITEELLLRGVWYAGLRRRFGITVSAAVSSVVFGALHLLGVSGDPTSSFVLFASTSLLGAAFALMYERSGSLWPPIVGHAGFNATAVALLPLA